MTGGDFELEARTYRCDSCGRIGFGWGWSTLTSLDPATGEDLVTEILCDVCEPWSDELDWYGREIE